MHFSRELSIAPVSAMANPAPTGSSIGTDQGDQPQAQDTLPAAGAYVRPLLDTKDVMTPPKGPTIPKARKSGNKADRSRSEASSDSDASHSFKNKGQRHDHKLEKLQQSLDALQKQLSDQAKAHEHAWTRAEKQAKLQLESLCTILIMAMGDDDSKKVIIQDAFNKVLGTKTNASERSDTPNAIQTSNKFDTLDDDIEIMDIDADNSPSLQTHKRPRDIISDITPPILHKVRRDAKGSSLKMQQEKLRAAMQQQSPNLCPRKTPTHSQTPTTSGNASAVGTPHTQASANSPNSSNKKKIRKFHKLWYLRNKKDFLLMANRSTRT